MKILLKLLNYVLGAVFLFGCFIFAFSMNDTHHNHHDIEHPGLTIWQANIQSFDKKNKDKEYYYGEVTMQNDTVLKVSLPSGINFTQVDFENRKHHVLVMEDDENSFIEDSVNYDLKLVKQK